MKTLLNRTASSIVQKKAVINPQPHSPDSYKRREGEMKRKNKNGRVRFLKKGPIPEL